MTIDEQIKMNWLRWGLEEIIRHAEPNAGSIAEEALQSAGFPIDASIPKPKPRRKGQRST